MEQTPKKIPPEVRKNPDVPGFLGGDWEDSSINSEGMAETVYTLFQEILKEYGLDLKKLKVLEVGSGSGIFLNYLKKQGIDVVGVDARPRGGGFS